MGSFTDSCLELYPSVWSLFCYIIQYNEKNLVTIPLFSAIDFVGDAPYMYDIMKPLLARCTATQLLNIEEANPVSTVAYR